jgi:PAS domain S-box-containing protein
MKAHSSGGRKKGFQLPDVHTLLWNETNDYLLIMDETGNIIQANRAAVNGLEYTAAELMNVNVLQLCPPGEQGRTAKTVRKMQAGKINQCSIALQTKSGKFTPGDTRLYRGIWQGKHVLFGINNNVSAISDMIEEFAKLFCDNPALISINALDSGRFIEVNEAFLNVLGFERREVVGRRGWDLGIVVNIRELVRIYLEVIKKGSAKNHEIQLRDKQGGYHVGLYTANLIKKGNQKYVLSIINDITEKLKIEKELDRQKRFLKTMVDAIPDLVFYKDRDGVYLGCNRAFAGRIFGLSETGIVGKTNFDLFTDKELSEFFTQKDTEVFHSGEPRIYDEKITLVNGTVIDIETVKTPFYDDQGQVAGLIGIARDITARRLIEERLRESEERYSAIINSAPEIVVIHKKGKLVFINNAGVKALGYQRAELMNINIMDFLTDSSKQKFNRVIAPKEPNESIEDFEIELWVKSGKIVSFIVKTTAITYENEPASLTVLIDITTRKKYEEELTKRDYLIWTTTLCVEALLDNRNYNEAVSSCFAILGEGIGVHRIYLYQNQYDETGNFATGQIAEWNSEIIEPPPSSVNPEVILFSQIREFREPLKQGLAIYNIVREIKNGWIKKYLKALNILSIAILPVFVGNRFWGIVVFGDCQYERIWNDAESITLSTFTNSLGKAIERSLIEAELEASKKAAEAANVLKSRFLANMSHEIRTPMNGIIGFLDILQRSNLSIEQQAYVGEAKSASEALMYIINDILDFSKIEAGKLGMESIPFNIRTAIEEAVSIHIPKALEKKLEIHTLIKSAVPEQVAGDPGRLRQVLNNLLSNAVKFTEHGEINISVECVQIKDDSACIHFEVRDTGIGIKKEDMSKLFQPFEQGDASTTRKYGGTGLGLAISKELVRMMDGEMGVTSTPGKETNFYFTAWFKIVSFGGSVVFEFSALDNKNILIVDDNQNSRKVISAYLKGTGSNVMEVDAGDKAIRLLLSRAGSGLKFDIVLVDYQMPGMNGHQFAEALQAIPLLNDVKLILLTSAARKGDAVLAGKRNFAGYLSKPIKKEELLDCISMMLGLEKVRHDNSLLITRHVVKEAKMALQPKILLAEDNETNCKWMITVLKHKGLNCDVAENGLEALKARMERNYDLILMDCQMPVMDGYETTVKIREFESGRTHTPIIAMTAYAMEEDRQKCFAAGMDDYISKPIDLDLLFQIIAKYSKPKQENSSQKTITEEYIEQFAAQTGLPVADVKNLFMEHIHSLPGMIRSMEEALQKKDYLEVKRIAHQLKGASGNLRINVVSDKAKQIEKTAEVSDNPNCWILLNELKGLLDRFID